MCGATLLLAVVTSPVAGHGTAAPDTTVRGWTISDGLPQSSVNAIVEAADGSLWVGTYGGLARFDGTRFRTADPTSMPGLPSNRVTALTLDADQTLWGGCQHGLIFRVGDKAADAWTLNSPDPRREDPTIGHLDFDRAGTLFIATDLGLWTFDPRADAAPQADDRLDFSEKTSIAVDDAGVWVTAAGAIHLLSERGAEPLPPPAGHEWAMPMVHPPRDAGPVYVTDPPLIAIIEDGRARPIDLTDDEWSRGIPAHDVAVCRRLGPVTHLSIRGDFESGDREVIHRVARSGASDAWTAFVDRHGQLWVGDGQRGLECRSASVIQKLPLPAALDRGSSTVLVQPDGTIWVNLQGAQIVRVEPDGGHRVFNTSKAWAMAMADDVDGSVIVGASSGVLRITNGRLSEPLVPVEVTSDVRGLEVDESGAIWIAARRGLWRYTEDALDSIALPGDADEPLLTLTIGAGGEVWTASKDKLYRVTGPDPRVFDLSQDAPMEGIRAISRRPDGSVWVASYGTGFFVVDDKSIRLLTERDGLPENNICDMIVDAEGDALWLLGNRGAYHVAISALTRSLRDGSSFPRYRAYVPADGMVEASHGHPPGGIMPDGSIVLTTIAGPRIIRPLSHTAAVVTPPVVSRVLIDGVDVPADGSPVLIPADASRIDIEISTVNLVAPQSSHYACRLRGFDTDWIDIGTDAEISYTRLEPGRYALDMRAALGDGPWVQAVAPLHLEWRPAWHQTTVVRAGAASGAVVAVGLAVFAIRRRQRRRFEMLQRRLLHQREAQERERRLVEEVNHRVRNNMASVLSMIQLLRATGKDGRTDVTGPLSSRIHAMAGAHEVLSTRHWSAVKLSEIINGVVTRGEPNLPCALVVQGDDPQIASDRCQSLALTMNELAANAGEHGAWSVPAGMVRITVRTTDQGDLLIEWAEERGPPVEPPSQLGCGLELARGFATHDLGGELTLSFDPAGLRATIRMPAA